MLLVNLSNPFSNPLFVLNDLFEFRPIFIRLRYFTMPVSNLGLILNVGIDSSFKDVCEVGGRSERLFKVAREVNVTESWCVTDVEQWNMSKRNRFGEA